MYLRRIKIFAAVIALALAGVLCRLVVLQIVRGDDHHARAKKLLQYTELLPTARGRILDRNGVILAFDKPCVDFCLDYRFMTEQERWIRRQQRKIARREGLSETDARKAYEHRAAETWRLAQRATGMSRIKLQNEVVKPIVDRIERIRGNLGFEVREQRQAHPIARALRDPGVFETVIESGQTVGVSLRPSGMRWYPRGPYACHVIGLTGQLDDEARERLNIPDSGSNWLERMRTNYTLIDTAGISGVEKLSEKLLRGRRGYKRYRRPGLLESEAPSEWGKDVHLTIDMDLQQALTHYIPKGRNGAIVVLSLPRREILALVSMPVYDLNRYRRDYAELAADVINQPLTHRAVGGLYPPGSTMKPLAAIAALSEGKITPLTEYTCYGTFLSGGRGPKCWCWPGGHGSVDVTEALKNSCNVFFYHIGEDMGVAALSFWMRRFGLDRLAGTGLSAEMRGRLPTSGSRGEGRSMAIGQGPVVTPLHVANMVATIATGELRSPILVLEGGPKQTRTKAPGTQQAWKLVRDGMDKVVNDETSKTAYKYFHGPALSFKGAAVEPLDLRICGKTGTAQTSLRVVDTPNGRLVIKGNTVWFMCYAPKDDPKIAIAVMLEYVADGGGGKNCAPIAREILRLCQKRGYIPRGAR